VLGALMMYYFYTNDVNFVQNSGIKCMISTGNDVFITNIDGKIKIRLIMIPNDQKLLYLPDKISEQIIFLEQVLKRLKL